MTFGFFLFQAPAKNCNGSLEYSYGINGSVTSNKTSETSAIFYLEGSQLFNFTVRAHNSLGPSPLQSILETTEPIGMYISRGIIMRFLFQNANLVSSCLQASYGLLLCFVCLDFMQRHRVPQEAFLDQQPGTRLPCYAMNMCIHAHTCRILEDIRSKLELQVHNSSTILREKYYRGVK